jgi:hypothetical protein
VAGVPIGGGVGGGVAAAAVSAPDGLPNVKAIAPRQLATARKRGEEVFTTCGLLEDRERLLFDKLAIMQRL